MTDLLSCQFLGGSAGAAVTSTTESFFTSTSGTVVYADGGGGRMGFRPSSSTFGECFRDNVSSRTVFALHWKVKYESSTATSAFWDGLKLRSGTTNLADVGLRNASGSRHAAARGTSSVYFLGNGDAVQSDLLAANEIWSFEAIINGTSLTVNMWDSDKDFNASLTSPTYTNSATLAAVPDNYWFGVGANTGVSAVISDIRFTDGAAPVTPGTLTFVSNVNASDTQIVAVAKVAAATTVRIEATPSAGGATVVGSGVAPTDNYVRLVVSGLSPNTLYNYTIYVDNTSRRTGSTRTMPAAGAPASFSFGWGSCFDSNISGVFALITARDPLFFSMVGDWGYQYISTGVNGNTSPTDIETVRTHREAVLAAANPQNFFSGRSTSYTYSDCDGAGANADSTTGGHATGAVQAAYRQQFAHPTLPLTDCGARAWVIGRVKFIQTDETSLASLKTATDDSSKTKLGATQKQWFKDELDSAAAAAQIVIWFGDGPWITPTNLGSVNEWARYNTERVELGNYISSLGINIIRLHGDTHTLFYDNGTNNPWGGFPTACGAPMHTTAQTFGYTTSGAKWPTVSTASSRQYGIADVVDDGNEITVTMHGWSSTSSAPTEVERYTAAAVFIPSKDPIVFSDRTLWRNGIEIRLDPPKLWRNAKFYDLTADDYVDVDPDPAFLAGWGGLPVWRSEMEAGDLAKWNLRDSSTFGLLNDTGYPKASQVTIQDGLMRIRANWLTNPVSRTDGQGIMTHNTGYIDTRNLRSGDKFFSQRYGRWEIRCAPPVTEGISHGIMPNFWLRCDSTPGEIDVYEAWGGAQAAMSGQMLSDFVTYTKHSATTTIHSSTTGGTVNGKPYIKTFWRHWQSGVPRDMNVGFHTFVFEYTPTYMKSTVDGITVFNVTPASTDPYPGRTGTLAWLWDSDFFGSPLHMRINMHVGPSPVNWGLPDPNNRQWTQEPSDYLIDYVRVWPYVPA